MYFWLALATIAFLWVVFNTLKAKGAKNDNLPGPRAVPIFGNIFQMMTAFKTYTFPLTHFAKIYGEVYRFKIPFDEIVILASYDAVQTVLNKDEAMGRDLSGIMVDRNFEQNLGIVFANGEMWDKSRKWTVKNLRNYGFDKTRQMEKNVYTEIQEFLDSLESKESIIFPVHQAFLPSMSSIMYKMMAGSHAQISRETLAEMNRLTFLMEKASGPTGTLGAALAVYFPRIRLIFPDWTGRSIQLLTRSVIQTESRKVMTAAKEKMSQSGAKPDSLAEKFVAEMMKEGKESEIFTDLNHDIIFTDLFQTSSHTTGSYVESFFLYMILHPGVQEKVYKEIKDILPLGQEISFEDKNRMIYTQAVMLEVHRMAMITPILVPRRAKEDFYYKSYLIKKGSMIMTDLNSLFHDPQIFSDPHEFKPKRFIDSSGCLINHHLIIPFSVGKRSCPGQLFAEVTAFLLTLNVIQKYKLSTVPGEPEPRKDMHIGFTSNPYPFSMVMMKRGDE